MPSDKSRNIAAAAYANVVEHPERHRQGEWASKTACGTAYCYAGHAVAAAYPDAKFDFGVHRTTSTVLVDGEAYHIQGLATDLLELSFERANDLFASHNTVEDIRKHLERFGLL